ncbi:MAG: hypothetical protein Q9178_005286 [Gyalolechia marmorata]
MLTSVIFNSCHHLHTNRALHLSLDPQKHIRFNCDYCEHPILGIGRTSTQTTLASIETNAAAHRSWRSEPDVALDQDHQSIHVSLQSPPLRVDTSGTSGPLSTIAEGVSPAQQSSAMLSPAVSGDMRSERSISHESAQIQQLSGYQEHRIWEPRSSDTVGPIPTDDRSKPPGGFWIRQSQPRLRERIRRHLRKPRSFNISKLGLHVDVSPTPSAPARPLMTNAYPAGACDVTDDLLPASAASTAPRANVSSGVSTPVRRDPVSIRSAELPQQSASGHPDPLIGRTLTLAEKQGRIRALRREATLKRQAELISRCECQSECRCRNGGDQSNVASLSPEPSERSIQVPGHYLHRLLTAPSRSSISGGSSSNSVQEGSYLVGVGGHLHQEESNLATNRRTSQAAESQQFPSDRLSQVSTLYFRSNESLLSLLSRRPASLRRWNTTPASVPRRSAEELRPDLIEVIRNSNFPESDHDPAQEAPSFPRGSESDAEDMSPVA